MNQPSVQEMMNLLDESSLNMLHLNHVRTYQ
jgi:hypothetical protein